MASFESDSPRVMFTRLFKSCFDSRPARSSSPKTFDHTVETDSTSSQHPSSRRTKAAPPSLDPALVPPGAAHMPKATTRRRTKAAAADTPATPSSSSSSPKSKQLKYLNSHAAVENRQTAALEAQLSKLFDSLQTDEDRETDRNAIGMAGIQDYMTKIHVNMENYEFFVLCEIVRVESLGQITRKGFVDGWKAAGVPADLAAQARHARQCIERVRVSSDYYKAVYRRTFLAGKELGQKAVDKEVAMAYWNAVFDPAVHPWQTTRTNWLDAWQTFLTERWKRGVNRDMWNQTLEFANRVMEDDSLGFWSEESAWPSVIDEFVLWCRETGIAETPAKKGRGENGDMEMDY